MRYKLRIHLPIHLRASRKSSRPTRRRSCYTSGDKRLWTIYKGIDIYTTFINDKSILKHLEMSDSTNGNIAFPLGREDYEKIDIFKTSDKTSGHAQSGAKPPKHINDSRLRRVEANNTKRLDGRHRRHRRNAERRTRRRGAGHHVNRKRVKTNETFGRARQDDILAPLRENTIENSRSIATYGDVINLGDAKAFDTPWLDLVPTIDIATLRADDELRKIQRTPYGSPYIQAATSNNGERPDVVDIKDMIVSTRSKKRSARTNA